MDIFDSKIMCKLAPKDGSTDFLLDKVNELKSLLKEEYSKNQNLYDRIDYDKFMEQNDDWYARRWVIYQRDVQTAFEMVKDTLKWRKELDLNNLKYEDFPREFYECGCLFEYGRDKKGHRVLYLRCRFFKPISDLTEIYNKFFAFIMDQIDKRSKTAGFSLMYDVTGAGLSNVEMANLKFMVNIRDRFPLSARLILIAGLPWVLMPVFKLIMSLMPANQAALFKLINLRELNQYIDDDQIPTSFGGTSKTKFQLIPSKSIYAREFKHLSKSSADKLKKHVESETNPSDFEIVPTLQAIE